LSDFLFTYLFIYLKNHFYFGFFSIEDFAKLYAEKLGVNEKVLQKTLWGDFYLNGKTKRVMKGAQEKAKKPMFVQFVLENLWAVYDTVVVRKVSKAVL
jgi:ribosome assembly protein 1